MGRKWENLLRFFSKTEKMEDTLNIPCFGYIAEHFVHVLIFICFTSFDNLYFLDLPCRTFAFMSTKRSTTIEILAKLKVEFFAEENFAEFGFVAYDPTHRNLFRKVIKIMLITHKKTILV